MSQKKSAEPTFDPSKPFEVVEDPTPEFDPSKPYEEISEPKGLLQRISDTVNAYTGAPTRAAIGAMQEKNKSAINAFFNQMGKDPSTAPSGELIAERAGLSTKPKEVMSAEAHSKWADEWSWLPGRSKPSEKKEAIHAAPSEIAGGAIEFGADWTNALPLPGMVLKGLRKLPADKIARLANTARATAAGAEGAEAGAKLKPFVKFFDSKGDISKRLGSSVDELNKGIDARLSQLEASGASVDGNTIYNVIREEIGRLRQNEAHADLANALEGELDEFLKTALESRKSSNIPLAKANEIGKSHGAREGLSAQEMQRAYTQAVQNVAESLDPSLKPLFSQRNELQSLIPPTKQAAAAPRGMDLAKKGVEFVLDAKTGGAMSLARDLVIPRLASSAAVTADAIANTIRRIPELKQLEVTQPVAFQAIVKQLLSEQAAQMAAGNELDKESGVAAQHKDFKNSESDGPINRRLRSIQDQQKKAPKGG